MPLEKNLTDEEMAIIEITEDPIWLGTFLRSTNNGSVKPEEWPRRDFKYRWYQKDLLTDQNEFIVLTAGRAVGKCSPENSRVYTYPYGYVTIKDLVTRRYRHGDFFIVYALDETQKLVQRRAFIEYNGKKTTYEFTTESGFTFEGTANHPILTPQGYRDIVELTEGDLVAVTASLPHESNQRSLTWEEIRWLGYVINNIRFMPESYVTLKYQRQLAEFEQIANAFECTLSREPSGQVRIKRKMLKKKHHAHYIIEAMQLTAAAQGKLVRLPVYLKGESLSQLKIFIESLYSAHGEFTSSSVKLPSVAPGFLSDVQEVLLRFGIETLVRSDEYGNAYNITRTPNDFARFAHTFDVPGITFKGVPQPVGEVKPIRFEPIVRAKEKYERNTYAIQVDKNHNYISDNIYVHNSLFMEDKIVYENVNPELVYDLTPQQTLATANVNQLTPLLDNIISRFLSSPFLRSFTEQINRSKGTLDFKMRGGQSARIHARIAGSKGESNMVGLHVPRIKVDEAQIFPMPAWIQMGPTFNTWETKKQQLYCGVPNGVREGSVLYYLDQRSKKYKKYRIPAHENPYFTLRDNNEAKNQYGGEDSEDYQHLILGRHGDPTFTMIPRDKIITEPFEFYSYRYSQTDKQNGRHYRDLMQLHKIPEHFRVHTMLSVDCGYADPTLAHVMARDEAGIWRTFARFRLTRIPFPEQAEFIDWLDSFYNFNVISLDLGAGGGGIGVMQDLTGDRFSKGKQYLKRVTGVRFGDFIDRGEDPSGNILKINSKSYGGQELARMITEGDLRFSEVDFEGMSQVERVAYQRATDGTNRYFVMSDTGRGKSQDDHIFASYVVFILTLMNTIFARRQKKLFSASWIS